MSDQPTGEPSQPEPAQVADAQFVNAVIPVPVDGLASFYQVVADWWESEGQNLRGRIIR